MAQHNQLIKFEYKNHRGEVTQREIIPDSLEWIDNPGYNYQPGWFLSGFDFDKQARRSFALCNIILPKADERRFYKLIQFKGVA